MALRLMFVPLLLCSAASLAQSLSQDEKAALEKQILEKTRAIGRIKALNSAVHQSEGAISKARDMEISARGLQGEYLELAKKQIIQQWREATLDLQGASEIDPKADAVWASMAECYAALARLETGTGRDTELAKAAEASSTAIELNPEVASYYTRYALTLVGIQKFDEAEAAVSKAAHLNPFSAGKYFFDLGAVMTSSGQAERGGQAFRDSVAANPDYADAQYQYGLYLASKASTGPDGRMILPPGTVEAFRKYLKLEPEGKFADVTRDLLSSLGHK
jgi:tetratricopeptide (TPR) repeat protein